MGTELANLREPVVWEHPCLRTSETNQAGLLCLLQGGSLTLGDILTQQMRVVHGFRVPFVWWRSLLALSFSETRQVGKGRTHLLMLQPAAFPVEEGSQ